MIERGVAMRDPGLIPDNNISLRQYSILNRLCEYEYSFNLNVNVHLYQSHKPKGTAILGSLQGSISSMAGHDSPATKATYYLCCTMTAAN